MGDNKKYLSSGKSKGLSDETIKPPDNNICPLIDYLGNKIRVKFTGGSLKQPKCLYTHDTLVNIYIVYKPVASGFHTDDHMLKICLFGAVTLTQNGYIDKYQYSGYGIYFDKK